MKSAEDFAILILGKDKWNSMCNVERQAVLKIARAYAAQYGSNSVTEIFEKPYQEKDSASLFGKWKDDRNQEDLRNRHDGDEPVIGHFRD